jgi:ATP-dependent RNA helicase DDX56/DBP9
LKKFPNEILTRTINDFSLQPATMKRKLDSNDIPVPVPNAQNSVEEDSFASLGLDSRLLQGIAKQKFQKPTPVQLKAIPLTLQGRDVLARARTGTGKTAAYLLPILQLILKRKEVSFATLDWGSH